MPLTILDLIGTPGTDVVLEGPQIAEFCEALESCPVQQDVSMLSRFRRADRIIGKTGHVDGAVGYLFGRSWIAESRTTMRFGPINFVEVPRYRCHKEVWALKIKHVSIDADGNYSVVPENETYAPIAVSRDYVKKHNPTSGGYYVVYKDGYKSFSPAAAFEEGYTRI